MTSNNRIAALLRAHELQTRSRKTKESSRNSHKNEKKYVYSVVTKTGGPDGDGYTFTGFQSAKDIRDAGLKGRVTKKPADPGQIAMWKAFPMKKRKPALSRKRSKKDSRFAKGIGRLCILERCGGCGPR